MKSQRTLSLKFLIRPEQRTGSAVADLWYEYQRQLRKTYPVVLMGRDILGQRKLALANRILYFTDD